MSYKEFQKFVRMVIASSGVDDVVLFNNNTEKGQYKAVLSSGVIIVGNATTFKVTVIWGTGHQAQRVIA